MEAPLWAMLLLGFALGYFLNVNLLLLITAVSVLGAAYLVFTTWGGGLAALIGHIASVKIGIMLAAMWGTYIVVSGAPILRYLHALLR